MASKEKNMVQVVLKSIVLLSAVLFLTSNGWSQSPDSRFVPVAPGVLSNSYVRCFLKDSKGYMWIGTEDALIRYDGQNAFRYVNVPHDPSTIANNTINTIIEGNDKQVWIGTAQGLCIYNRELDNFVTVDSIKQNKNYLNNRYITDLEFDSQGRLWIGTHEGGINIYNIAEHEFEYIIDPPHRGVLPSSNFINILKNVSDTIWCASKGGLLLYDTRTRKRITLPKSLTKFVDAQIKAIVPEPSGHLLLATITGEITRVNRNDLSVTRIFSGEEFGESANRILGLCVNGKGDILTGGENSGFSIIDHKTNRITRILAQEGDPKALPTNSIETIYADDSGLIWIGTWANGVFVMDNNPKKFVTSEKAKSNSSLAKKEVRSFAEDREGNVWIASYGVGLTRIKRGTNELDCVVDINSRISNKNVTSVIFDSAGQMWLGTAGKGVYRINPRTNELVNFSLTSDGFGNDQVYCLQQDSKGTMWAGTWGSGLFYFDESKNQFVSATEYGQPNHIPNTGYITDIIEDENGTYWVGTLYGLYELKRKEGNSFTYRLYLPGENNGGIAGSQIQAVVEDGDKNLWIGTPEGLSFKKRGVQRFENIKTGTGNVVNAVRSLVVDKRGSIWIGGNYGLSKFDKNANAFVTYSREDGLKSNNFHRKAALCTSSGKLYFGSSEGFDSFYPDSIHSSSPDGVIVLSDLKINNQSVKPGGQDSPLQKHISLTSELDLNYDQRSFVIDFVVLDHSQSSNYSYCYKLEGFDEDWNCTGSKTSATYTNIDPGDYVFVVKAANRDGVWLDEPLRLEITIQQVFWKTWWAFCFYIVFLIVLLYFLLSIRIERLKLKSEIMFEKLRREQEHNLSESKTQFFTNVAHEFRTPLSLIMIPLESLMGSNDVPGILRERIYTAFKNASRMKRLVNELLDFNKLEGGNLQLNVQHGELVQFIFETSSAFDEMATKRNIGFSVSSESPVIIGWFDRDKLERMIFNLLSNAFKFTADGGQIKLAIKVTQSILPNGALSRCVELIVEDNGIGITPEELAHIFDKFYQANSSKKISSPGTGIGLSLTKALVELHHGTITATSTPGETTVFTLLLPIDAKVYNIKEDVTTPPEIVYTAEYTEAVAQEIVRHDDDDANADKPHILIVEDNNELREYLALEMRREFFVLEARDGQEGLAITLEKNPDMIISDIMMPVMNGIEFCQTIKSDINTSHIPFILLTAKATTEDQINGIQTGADLYVSKPFNIRYLITHVRQIITSRRQLYARFSQDVYLTPGKATTNELDQQFLQKIIDFVINNLQDPQLTVESVVELFSMSRVQVYRKVKALTGKTVVEFIRMIRMKQAIKLMDSHQLTLSEIAFEVGFNSASYFTRCFKEEFGKTPSDYLEGVK